MEFLYFYLMPETPSVSRTSSPLQRSPTGRLGRPAKTSVDMDAAGDLSETLSTDHKQRMLGEHLANVDDLVRDLHQYTPFVAAGGK